jgi:hypothetical protein
MEYVEIIKNKWVKIKKNRLDGLKNHLVLLSSSRENKGWSP